MKVVQYVQYLSSIDNKAAVMVMFVILILLFGSRVVIVQTIMMKGFSVKLEISDWT